MLKFIKILGLVACGLLTVGTGLCNLYAGMAGGWGILPFVLFLGAPFTAGFAAAAWVLWKSLTAPGKPGPAAERETP